MIAAVIVSASLITMIAPLLPLAVDALSDSEFASPRVKALLLGLVVAVGTALDRAVIQDGVAIIATETLVQFGLAWAVSIGSFFGVLHPTGASDFVQDKTASVALVGRGS